MLHATAHIMGSVLPGTKVMLVCRSRAVSTHMILQALLPLFISPLTGRGTTGAVSLGAMGDSYYEYLLKARPAARGHAGKVVCARVVPRHTDP